jgi:predicted nucleic acid-binding protein
VIGWLLDTNVVAALIHPAGAPSVKSWAAEQDEHRLHLSILTIGEYEKGIHNMPAGHPDRPRHMATRDGLLARFQGRILPVSDAVVRRWGVISGTTKRATGHSPSVIDTMLAATALETKLYLVTRNVKDVQHSGAMVFDPWNDDPSRFPLSPTVSSQRPGP